MKLMQELPVSNIWMDRLYKLSMSVKYNPNFSYKDETLALYNRMNEAQKTSITGQEITVNLFPPTVVKEGDKMADTELFDLDGKIHHLTDFNGKYILLDFWSGSCGPCKASIPELEKIVQENERCLTLVSITTDGEKSWRKYSDKHSFVWYNLCDGSGWKGLVARFGFNGVPAFVLLSPEGKVLSKRIGYGKGIIDWWLEKFIGASYTRVEK